MPVYAKNVRLKAIEFLLITSDQYRIMRCGKSFSKSAPHELLADKAWKAADSAAGCDITLEVTERTAIIGLEAAALLRDGWSPGLDVIRTR